MRAPVAVGDRSEHPIILWSVANEGCSHSRREDLFAVGESRATGTARTAHLFHAFVLGLLSVQKLTCFDSAGVICDVRESRRWSEGPAEDRARVRMVSARLNARCHVADTLKGSERRTDLIPAWYRLMLRPATWPRGQHPKHLTFRFRTGPRELYGNRRTLLSVTIKLPSPAEPLAVRYEAYAGELSEMSSCPTSRRSRSGWRYTTLQRCSDDAEELVRLLRGSRVA